VIVAEKEVEKLASFVTRASYDMLSKEAVSALKIRVLDSIGCAIGALNAPVITMLKTQIDDFGGNPIATFIGGGKGAPDRAAFFNGALVRYLDFNDSFLAKRETCHPSDNFGAVLAASEYAKSSGKEFLTALAVSYQVQCRLSEEAPVRHKGFDHTTLGAYAVAAGVSKALGLSTGKTASAIAMAAVANNALRVTRTGQLSHWKGLAYPNTAFSATHAAFLALCGITGPLEIFEGNKGFIETISGPFFIDWNTESLEAVRKTIIKKYNAEIHSQSALEAVFELRQKHALKADSIEKIELDVFDVAYHIIGGGEEGAKKEIKTKEEADHSLPYMIAVMLLDGTLQPAQYEPARIVKDDVQKLLQKVHVYPKKEFSAKFPALMPITVRITLKDKTVITAEKSDYEGFFTRPISWDMAVHKCKVLARGYSIEAIIHAVSMLETISIVELTALLAKVKKVP
jgi:2-methylcitrate dehydratase